MLLTTAVDVDRRGTRYGDVPVPPDQPAPVETAERAAKEWLRSQCKA